MDASPASYSLSTQVQLALSDSPLFSLRRVHVEIAEGLVRLQGTVRSFYQKQMAQETVRRIDGVEQIENQLQVDRLTPSEVELAVS